VGGEALPSGLGQPDREANYGRVIYSVKIQHTHTHIYNHCGPGSSVGIATDYGLDGPGSNSDGDKVFRPSRSALQSTESHVKLIEQKRSVMAHAQKPDLVFQRIGRVHLYRRGCQFSRLLAAEVCASAIVMLDRPCPIQCRTAGYPLHSPFSPFTSPVRFRVPSHSISALLCLSRG